MNFREIENIENLASSTETKTSGFHQEIIADYLEKEKRKHCGKRSRNGTQGCNRRNGKRPRMRRVCGC